MRRAVLLLSLLVCAAVTVRADTAFGVSFDDVLALPAPPPDRVESYGQDVVQRREFWLHDDGVPRPLVVLVHGGCWLNAFGVDHARALAAALRDAGYVVLAPEYRRVGDDGGGWPSTLLDVLDAVRGALERGDELGFDARRYAIVGHSAGGHLALLADHELRADTTAGRPPLPAGVVGLAAITDPETYALGAGSCNTATPRFFGGMPDEVPGAYRTGSPVRARTRIPAPGRAVLLQGDADTIVPVRQAEALAAVPPGEGVDIVRLPGAGHFDLIHPGTPAFDALRSALAQLLPEPAR